MNDRFISHAGGRRDLPESVLAWLEDLARRCRVVALRSERIDVHSEVIAEVVEERWARVLRRQ
jgi:hypothetical protein